MRLLLFALALTCALLCDSCADPSLATCDQGTGYFHSAYYLERDYRDIYLPDGCG